MRLYVLLLSFLTYNSATEIPVIGILAQEAFLIDDAYPKAHSFIAASFVKFLESSGARVIPVWIGQDARYYERVVKYTNGIVFPGGGTYFNQTKGYGEAASKIFEIASKMDEKGDSYPILGICLGMQVLMFANLGKDIRGNCLSKKVALPLHFVTETSKIYEKASPQLLRNLKRQNITYNYHKYCLFEEDLKNEGILTNWNIITTNKDVNGLNFVSTMEHKKYPFFGIQYHPEKNAFEFKRNFGIPHSLAGIEMAQYLSNFFIGEARKNNHTFPSTTMEDGALIYNYDPVYSIGKTSYEQLYIFTPADYKRRNLRNK